jgi:hypothetical protein
LAKNRSLSVPDHCHAGVTITGLFHDLALKRSSVSVVWGDDPDKRMNLPIPCGCALDDIQAEAEKAMRVLSDVIATISVKLPK